MAQSTEALFLEFVECTGERSIAVVIESFEASGCSHDLHALDAVFDYGRLVMVVVPWDGNPHGSY